MSTARPAAVDSACGVALGVLVGEHGSPGLEHGTRDEVLGGDHLEGVALTRELAVEDCRDLGVDLGDALVHDGVSRSERSCSLLAAGVGRPAPCGTGWRTCCVSTARDSSSGHAHTHRVRGDRGPGGRPEVEWCTSLPVVVHHPVLVPRGLSDTSGDVAQTPSRRGDRCPRSPDDARVVHAHDDVPGTPGTTARLRVKRERSTPLGSRPKITQTYFHGLDAKEGHLVPVWRDQTVITANPFRNHFHLTSGLEVIDWFSSLRQRCPGLQNDSGPDDGADHLSGRRGALTMRGNQVCGDGRGPGLRPRRVQRRRSGQQLGRVWRGRRGHRRHRCRDADPDV